MKILNEETIDCTIDCSRLKEWERIFWEISSLFARESIKYCWSKIKNSDYFNDDIDFVQEILINKLISRALKDLQYVDRLYKNTIDDSDEE